MKDIRATKGRRHIAALIAQGEHEQQDFKFQISDSLKIARSLSAFANRSGGRLLIGVKDNGVVAGVRSEEDIYMIEQAASLYCRPALDVDFKAFKATDEGAVVIVATIPPHPRPPVQAREPDGSWRAYYRVADENILASPLMVRAWRLRLSDAPVSFDLSGSASLLLSLLDTKGFATADDLMLAGHISRADAEECIVRLAAIDVVTFSHRKSGFVVVKKIVND